jgi:hypothetical protein
VPCAAKPFIFRDTMLILALFVFLFTRSISVLGIPGGGLHGWARVRGAA